MTLVEIALDDVAGARVAEAAGADRLELCNGLADNGGTTPSVGFVAEVAESVERVPLMVLVRPRGGDFVYTPEELAVMVRDIELLRTVADTGFVIGALTPDGEVDAAATRSLVIAAAGATVTFHKAFDSTRDLDASLETLAGLGVDRVLTSGGRRTAAEGAGRLRELRERAADRLTIVAGGSVRAANVAGLVAESGVTEVHLRAAVPRPSAAAWANPEQGYAAAPVSTTDGEAVRGVVEALRGGAA